MPDKHGAAGVFDARGITHAVGIRFDLRAGHGKHRHRELPAVAKFGQIAQFVKAQLRRREHHDIDPIVGVIGFLQLIDIGSGDAQARQSPAATSAEPAASGVRPSR